jgi:hypothetical protein
MKLTSLETFKNNVKQYFSSYTDIPYLHKILLLKRFDFNVDCINKNRCFLESPIVDRINMTNKHKLTKLQNEISKTTADCFEDWPICIYDSETPYSIVNCIVYKVATSLDIIDDYLDDSTLKFKKFQKKKHKFDNILIERKIHKCGKKLKKKVEESEISDDSNNLSTIDDNRSDKEKNLSDVEIPLDYSRDDIIINSGSKISNLY